MKKKILSLCLVVALLATAVIGGTLAYFTDKDQNTNEFTVGGIEIDLWENVAHEDGAGNEKMTPDDDAGKGTKVNPNVTYADIMPGDVMTKVVTVENKENYPVYVALAIKQENYANFNKYIDGVYEKNNAWEAHLEEGQTTMGAAMQNITDDIFSGDGWKLVYDKKAEYDDDGYDTGYGLRYVSANVESAKDQTGAESYVDAGDDPILIAVDYTMTKVNDAIGYKGNMMNTWDAERIDTFSYSSYYELDTDAQNRMWVYYLYLPAGESYTLDLSVTCPTYITAENIAAFDNMKIDVRATAIQVDGFKTAKEAFQVLADTYKFGFGN